MGEQRAAREEGGFSFRNAHVLEVDGQTAGMLLGYRLPDAYDAGDLTSLPAPVRPLVELEAEAPGSWYVSESSADTMSLIVADENAGARRLYERLGYDVRARRPVESFPGFVHGGDWVLMVKDI